MTNPLREFCGFIKVPDASKITRFKQDFLEDLQVVFDNLADVTEPICQVIDSEKAEIKQLYINGHFCYAYKFGIITNVLCIIRHIAFYDKNFFEVHPYIKVEKKSDSPDEDKSVHDARLLIPTLVGMLMAFPAVHMMKRFQ